MMKFSNNSNSNLNREKNGKPYFWLSHLSNRHISPNKKRNERAFVIPVVGEGFLASSRARRSHHFYRKKENTKKEWCMLRVTRKDWPQGIKKGVAIKKAPFVARIFRRGQYKGRCRARDGNFFGTTSVCLGWYLKSIQRLRGTQAGKKISLLPSPQFDPGFRLGKRWVTLIPIVELEHVWFFFDFDWQIFFAVFLLISDLFRRNLVVQVQWDLLHYCVRDVWDICYVWHVSGSHFFNLLVLLSIWIYPTVSFFYNNRGRGSHFSFSEIWRINYEYGPGKTRHAIFWNGAISF